MLEKPMNEGGVMFVAYALSFDHKLKFGHSYSQYVGLKIQVNGD
jgi:hypothetical protein